MWSRPGDLGAASAFLPLVLSHTLMTLTLGSVTTFTPEDAKAVLEKHNYYRRQEPATNMYEMNWNISLQQRADAWIQGCEFKHENCYDAGENLFFSTALHEDDIILRGLKAWHDEITLWSYTNGNCMAACHYTQVIWSWTTTVGCSAKVCPILKSSNRVHKDALLFACYYYPRGNFLGHYPYSRGTSCSQCAEGDTCSNDLCVSSGPESKSAPGVVKTLKPQTPVRHSMAVSALGGFQTLVKNFISQASQGPQSFTYRRESEKNRIEAQSNMHVNSSKNSHHDKNGAGASDKDYHPEPDVGRVKEVKRDKYNEHSSHGQKEGPRRDGLSPVEPQVTSQEQHFLQEAMREREERRREREKARRRENEKERRRKKEKERRREKAAMRRQRAKEMQRVQQKELERRRLMKELQAKRQKDLHRKRVKEMLELQQEELERQKELMVKERERVAELKMQKQLQKQKVREIHKRLQNKTGKRKTQKQKHVSKHRQENIETLENKHSKQLKGKSKQRGRPDGEEDASQIEETTEDPIQSREKGKEEKEKVLGSTKSDLLGQVKTKQNISTLQETKAKEIRKQRENMTTKQSVGNKQPKDKHKKHILHNEIRNNQSFLEAKEMQRETSKRIRLSNRKDKERSDVETLSQLGNSKYPKRKIENNRPRNLKSTTVTEEGVSKNKSEVISLTSNSQLDYGPSGRAARLSTQDKHFGRRRKKLKSSPQISPMSQHRVSQHRTYKKKKEASKTRQVRKIHPSIIDDYYSPGSIVTVVRVLTRGQIEQLEKEYEGEEHRPVIIKNPTGQKEVPESTIEPDLATTTRGPTRTEIEESQTKDRFRPMELKSTPHENKFSNRPNSFYGQEYKAVSKKSRVDRKDQKAETSKKWRNMSYGARGEQNKSSKLSQQKRGLDRDRNRTQSSWFYKPKSKKKNNKTGKTGKTRGECRDWNPMCEVWIDQCDKNYRVQHTCRETCGTCNYKTSHKRGNSHTPVRLSSYHTNRYLSPKSYHGAFRTREPSRHNGMHRQSRQHSRHRENRPKETGPLSLKAKPNTRPSRLRHRERQRQRTSGKVDRRKQRHDSTSGEPNDPEKVCKDRPSHVRACQAWAKRGFCATNSAVRNYCQKSCGQCDR